MMFNRIEYNKYSWIQIDEVQDLNSLQFAIIDYLANDTVVYLGDQQQLIYSFIGARQDLIDGLKERCKNHIHYFLINYRSPKYLLDVYNKYAIHELNISPNFLPKVAFSQAKEKNDLLIINTQEQENQKNFIAYFIQNNPYHKIGILVPTNKNANILSKALTERNISHFKISNKDIFDTLAVQFLFAHLSIFCFETNIIYSAKIIRQIKNYDCFRANNFAKELQEHNLCLDDIISYHNSSYIQECFKYLSSDIVLFDTETTGLDIENDDIIQIAALKIKNGKEYQFNIFLETDKSIPKTIGSIANPLYKEYHNNKKVSRRFICS